MQQMQREWKCVRLITYLYVFYKIIYPAWIVIWEKTELCCGERKFFSSKLLKIVWWGYGEKLKVQLYFDFNIKLFRKTYFWWFRVQICVFELNLVLNLDCLVFCFWIQIILFNRIRSRMELVIFFKAPFFALFSKNTTVFHRLKDGSGDFLKTSERVV